MSETPIYSMPEYQGRLTDREIENRVTEAEKRGDFNLWEQEVNPPNYIMPDQKHEAVAEPVATYEAISHAQVLRESIDHMPYEGLIKDVMDVTVQQSKVRSQFVLTA